MSNYPQKVIFGLELFKSRGGNNILDQGSADFFYQGPDNKEFQFCSHIISVTSIQPYVCSAKAVMGSK